MGPHHPVAVRWVVALGLAGEDDLAATFPQRCLESALSVFENLISRIEALPLLSGLIDRDLFIDVCRRTRRSFSKSNRFGK